MFKLLWLLLVPLASLADTAYHCSMGSYDYKGAVYSDKYDMTSSREQTSCDDRKTIPQEKLTKDYNENREKIVKQIDLMLDNPECKDVEALLKKYKEDMKKHWDDFDHLTKVRSDFVKENYKDMDMQKSFAFMAAFNATCSGGQNRGTSFINLDLINNIPKSFATVEIQKNGQVADSCSDVKAYGSSDLKEFKVSMKSAKGDTFKFHWDPYGVPDRVILKGGSGILYDSGCKGDDPDRKMPLEIPLKGVKEVSVEVVNSCESAGSFSAWELGLQCAEEPQELCKKPKDELTKLILAEVSYTKTLMDANALHRECLFHIDHTVLEELLTSGMISLESSPMKNTLCDYADTECRNRTDQLRKTEKTLRVPNAVKNAGEQPHFLCPSGTEDLFQQVSRAYCEVGWKRLGIVGFP